MCTTTRPVGDAFVRAPMTIQMVFQSHDSHLWGKNTPTKSQFSSTIHVQRARASLYTAPFLENKETAANANNTILPYSLTLSDCRLEVSQNSHQPQRHFQSRLGCTCLPQPSQPPKSVPLKDSRETPGTPEGSQE